MSCGFSASPLLSRPNFGLASQSAPRKLSTLAAIRCYKKDVSQQQLNLSVLRFTLGIPGLDESYLPRYIGYAFGGLIVLNHFVGSDSSSITSAQLRSEMIGLSLAVFSAAVPYIGKFLKAAFWGASPTEKKRIPGGVDQIFVMSECIHDDLKQDLAWGTYALLRNTNSISLIYVEDALCVRGYWNSPRDLSNEEACSWFRRQIQMKGLSELKANTGLNLLQAPECEVRKVVPQGVKFVLLQSIGSGKGFILVGSTVDEDVFTDKDKSWIAAIANKFTGPGI